MKKLLFLLPILLFSCNKELTEAEKWDILMEASKTEYKARVFADSLFIDAYRIESTPKGEHLYHNALKVITDLSRKHADKLSAEADKENPDYKKLKELIKEYKHKESAAIKMVEYEKFMSMTDSSYRYNPSK